MRILVCGGRDFSDRELLNRSLNTLKEQFNEITIIQGEAPGADYMARVWAVQNGIPFESFPADWKKHGKKAGFLRNARMLDEGKPDLVVAFPGGKGTDMMVRLAIASNVRTIRIPRKKD